MRANLLFRTFLILALIAGIMVSCTKEEDDSNPRNFIRVGTESPISLTNAFITDYGPVNGQEDIRHMHIDLGGPGLNYNSTADSFSQEGSYVEVEVYSSQDGGLPSGIYDFEISEVKQAFTFDAGFIHEQPQGHHHLIVGGSINIAFTDFTHYDITIIAELETGSTFSAHYAGSFIYTDQHD
jgi:hypothetical protein